MKFMDVKKQAIRCLNNEAYDHEVRRDLDVKNLFATGVVDKFWVAELIGKTSGSGYHCSPHHRAPEVDVHICRSWKCGGWWYVKFYFMEPDMIFISVHL
ncbi:hypothetical protein ABEH87_06035 [Erwinia sp. Eh17-17]|uniref:hypothetical protein n=1 Tax=Erwinia sp. Eh17-17 TaxID=3080330 RepID=UPI00320B32A5